MHRSQLASLSTDKTRQIIANSLRTAIENAKKEMRGVCCFSELVDHPLMWGHYSDGHRGFCLEFDTTKAPLFNKAHKVTYSDAIPRLDIDKIARFELGSVMDLVLTKAKCWEFEHEWRVLHNEGNILFGVERAALTKIYFGAKMPEEQQQ